MEKVLLNTKIHVPAFDQPLVYRKRLFDLLDQGKNKKLILVTAPAGYGKTSLIVDWLNRNKLPAAWYAIDENDNDPLTFLKYLFHAVEPFYPQIKNKLDQNLNKPELNLFWETKLSEWLNEFSKIKEDFFLVLDDLHLISNTQIYQILSFILRYQPQNLHLLFSGRADPQIPLAKLRSQNLLIEIVQSDLNFTIQESQQYFRDVQLLTLNDEELSALNQRTEGWISGLQMAGIALKNFSDEALNDQRKNFINNFSASNRYILDFLMEEVLTQQPLSTQTFLIFSSIPEKFNADLCDYLFTESNLNIQTSSELSRLEQQNLFLIPLDHERYWFRYHHLFRELLNKQLITRYKEKSKQYHLLVGQWFQKNRFSREAIDHFIFAADFDCAAQLIEAISESILMNGELNRLIRWGDLIPQDNLLNYPDLMLSVTLAKLLRGHDINHTGSILDAIQTPVNPFKLKTIQAYIKMYQGDYKESTSLAEEIIHHLEPQTAFYSLAAWLTKISNYLELDIPERLTIIKNMVHISKSSGNRLLASLAACQVGETYRSAANLKEGLFWLEESLQLATDPSGDYYPFAAEALSNLGDYAYLMGEFQKSAQYLQKALDLSKSWRKLASVESLCRYAILIYQQGQVDSAYQTIYQAEETAREIEILEADDYFVFLQKIKLDLWENHLAVIKTWIENRNFLQKPRQDQGNNIFNQRFFKYELVVFARYLLKTNQENQVITILTPLKKEMQAIGHRFLEMETSFLLAVAANQLNNRPQGIKFLEDALTIAQESQITQIFLEEELFIQTLNDYFSQIQNQKIREFIIKILPKKPNHHEKLTFDPLKNFLSEREIDVLNLLDSNLTSNEISQKLFVSPSTVQSHIKRIYVKLDVHSRWDAVQQAKRIREEGDFPP